MKLLIVEDDANLREFLGAVLKDTGYNVLLASSGKEAMTVFDHDPDIRLIISDYMMPNGNGRDLLLHVRKQNAQSPIFFLMTGLSEFTADDAAKLGAQEYIQKPFTIKPFLQLIKRYLFSDSPSAQS